VSVTKARTCACARKYGPPELILQWLSGNHGIHACISTAPAGGFPARPAIQQSLTMKPAPPPVHRAGMRSMMW
jgi:hypothetical protein